MRIGIDFDNTIAGYDKVFLKIAREHGIISEGWKGHKRELRHHLRSFPNGEKLWMGLQGQVYGKYMHMAQLVSGTANFFSRCLNRGITVFIVSHKTEYGHFDPERIPLRIESAKWMDRRGFFDPHCFGLLRENIYFESSRKEKVERIASLMCTHFIDDLEDVFLEPAFPQETQKILFSDADGTTNDYEFPVFCSWTDISRFILGEETHEDIKTWLKRMSADEVTSVKRIAGRGNSRVYRVSTANAQIYALKHYTDHTIDPRPRLNTEFKALQILHEHGITNVPKAIGMDEDMNLGLYEWVEGESVTNLTMDDLRQAIRFVGDLHLLSMEIGANKIRLASEACLSATDLIGQIEVKFKSINAARGSFPELSDFLTQMFEPMWREVKVLSYSLWPKGTRKQDLPSERQTLSPSDFGFHNAIQATNGKITFIDFDYFGWDDPVKLTADFVWHPAMQLEAGISAAWETAMRQLFTNDADFDKRFSAAMPLYGMRWAMILLNEFLPGYSERRRNAGLMGSYDEENVRRTQLVKARHCLTRVERMHPRA